VDLVAFGSPHFSLSECRRLAALMDGSRRNPGTAVIVTVGHDVLAAARAEGIAARLEAAGVQIVPDICWCSISEPVFPPSARVLMTNSGKYAHYAPGLCGRAVRFGSLAECAATACTGLAPAAPPPWLT
jgi:predicted aconitase